MGRALLSTWVFCQGNFYNFNPTLLLRYVGRQSPSISSLGEHCGNTAGKYDNRGNFMLICENTTLSALYVIIDLPCRVKVHKERAL